MGVAFDVNQIPSDQTLVQKFLNKPARLFMLIYVGIAVLFIQQTGTDLNIPLFVIFFISPVLPAMYVEGRWSRSLNLDELNTQHQFNVMRKHRWTFIFAGFIMGFIEMISGVFLKFLLLVPRETNTFENIESEAREPRLIAIFLFSFVICLVAIYTVASFYRVRAEDLSSGKRYNYFSSPAQITSLLAYSYIGVNFHFTFMWMGHYLNILNQGLEGGQVDHFIGVPLEFISSGIISPLLILNLLFFTIGAYASAQLPNYISGSLYKKIPRNELQLILLKLVGIAFVSTLFLYFIYQYSLSSDTYRIVNTLQMIIILATAGGMIYQMGQMSYNGNVCRICNLKTNKEGLCYSCDINEKTDQQFRINISRNLTYPYCPSCGVLWQSLSRKCQNIKCNFTIVLSCNKCAETLNPLWEECNKCGEKREPIPQVALKSPGSPGYARNQSFLMLFIAILIPTLMLQIIMVTTVYRRVGVGISVDTLDSMWDDLARIIILLVTVLASLYLIFFSLSESKKAIMQVANRCATAPGSITILASVMYLSTSSIRYLFTSFSAILFNLILLVFALLLTISSVYNYYKSLIQFRPLVGFDPLVAFDQVGE